MLPVADPGAGSPGSLVGQRITLELTAIAHGGHCVGRMDPDVDSGDTDGGAGAAGRVVFVRHGIPGEVVEAVVTKGRRSDRFVFADAVEVLTPSPHRVAAPCRYAGPGGCGGCDFQHVDLAHQRELKAQVVREQLSRLAGIERDVRVEPLPGDEEGLRWRSRVEFAVDRQGRAGLRPFHSHAVLPVEDCLIARREVVDTGVLRRRWPRQRAVDVVAPSLGDPVVIEVPGGLRQTPQISERVETPTWSGTIDLNARGFWQVHRGAAPTFLAHVLRELDPQPGERMLDLYAGVGLFARAVADAVGPDGAVLAIETDARALAVAERDTAGVEQLEWRVERVEDALLPLVEGGDEVDLIVLDPPRSGAGKAVMAQVLGLGARAFAYVACDPAALARDLACLPDFGYELDSLVAYDAFPMTHHVECIAVLRPRSD